MEISNSKLRIGDLVHVINHWHDEIVATGIYMGLTHYEDCVKILLDSSEIEEFDLVFYYLEKLN